MPDPHRFDIRVYYEDTDFSGLVYHASYLRFLERGRTEFLRALGISQATLFAGAPDRRVAFAVVRMEIDFRKPALMDDLVTVRTSLKAMGGASLTMHQRLERGGTLLVEATVKIATISDGRVARIPPALATVLKRGKDEADETRPPVKQMLTATMD